MGHSLLLLLFSASCCLAGRQRRIIRGEEARPHEFKSIVAVQHAPRGTLGGYDPLCGGSLINGNTVLTAAHCSVTSKLRVVAGHHLRSDAEYGSGVAGVETVGVDYSLRHPNYIRGQVTYDVMVLKLKRSIPESANIKYARLPPVKDQFPPAGTDCVVAGWGLTEDRSGQTSNALRKAHMTVLKQNPPNSPPGTRNDPSIIFARPGGPIGSSMCKGDSGGPLYCPATDGGEPFQVGTVSGGDNHFCGSQKGLGRFGRVQHVIDWIKEKAARN